MANSESSLVEQKKSAPSKVPNWAIAGGLALTVTLAAAGTVYYVKTNRKKELDYRRYARDEDPNEGYFSKFTRYFTVAATGFTGIRSFFSDFFYKKTSPPLVSQKSARASKSKYSAESPFESSEEDSLGVVNEELAEL